MVHPLYYPVFIGHSFLTLFMIIGWLSNNRTVLWTLFFTNIAALVLFLLLGGCFISRIEYKLGGENYTVIDPILKKVGITASRESRTYGTMIIFICSLLMTSYKLFLREEVVDKQVVDKQVVDKQVVDKQVVDKQADKQVGKS